MRIPFCVVQDVPKTQYYDVWQLRKMLHFVGNIRSYLLDEFNQQVVDTILRFNDMDAPARYVCDYKLGNEDIDELFNRFAEGDIGYDEVMEEMLKDKA